MTQAESCILISVVTFVTAKQFFDEEKYLVTVMCCLAVSFCYLMRNGSGKMCSMRGGSRGNDVTIWNKYIRGEKVHPTSSLCCCLLVPLAVVCSSQYRESLEGSTDYQTFRKTLGILQAIASVVACCRVLFSYRATQTSAVSEKETDSRSDAQLVASATAQLAFITTSIFICCNVHWIYLGSVCVIVQLSAVLVQCITQAYLPLWSPLSFTLGEAAIISQALGFFVGSTACNLLQKFSLIFLHQDTSSIISSTSYYMEIAVLSCLLVAVAMLAFKPLRSILGFYAVFGFIFGCLAFPGLYVLLGENFITWTWTYITETPTKIYLFAYWVVCCLVGAIVVFVHSGIMSSTTSFSCFNSNTDTSALCSKASNNQSLSSNDYSHSNSHTEISQKSSHSSNKNSQSQSHPPNDTLERESPESPRHSDGSSQTDGAEGASTCVRKLFHILAVAIFVPGAMLQPTMLCVAGTCCLVVFIMMEMMRILQIPPLGDALQKSFVLLLDEQDQGPLILTHIYLLVGCVGPLWVFPILTSASHVSMYAGIISLGVGDTMAAIVGSTIGTHHWPGMHRTVEGTAAAVVSQMLCIFLLQFSGVLAVAIWWPKVFLAVVMTSLTEAFTHHVDNLLLPLVMYSLLL